MIKTLQAKHVPKRPILAFLASLEPNTGSLFTGWDTSVEQAMPPGTPFKIGLAVMRALIKRGWVEGCGCGCRGDFRVTEAGKQQLINEL